MDNRPRWFHHGRSKHPPIHWTAFGETPPTDEEIKAYYDKPRAKPVLFNGTFREFCNLGVIGR